MSRPVSSSGIASGGFASLNAGFPAQTGVRPSGFNAMSSIHSPFNNAASSATPTYSSLKSSLLRGTAGLFNQQQTSQQPQQQNAFGLSTQSPFGASPAASSPSRFPTSPFGSPQKTGYGGFGSPLNSPSRSTIGGVGGGINAGALVPSIPSLTSPTKSPSLMYNPNFPNSPSSPMSRGGVVGAISGGASTSPMRHPVSSPYNVNTGTPSGWPGMSPSKTQPRPAGIRQPGLQQRQANNMLRGVGSSLRPSVASAGGRMTGTGGNPRFTRVHASQFLNSTPPSPSRKGGAGASPQKLSSPAKSAETTLNHKCRFASCEGKSFLTEQVRG